MASVDWEKLHEPTEVESKINHNDTEKRLQAEHANKHINKDLTPYNLQTCNAEEACNRYKKRMGLKEHQLLLVFATELKSLCQQLNIFIFTASQLNGEAATATIKDQNLLSGSKALSNKLDVGFICMPPSKSELKKIDNILRKQVFFVEPNMCTWIYKIRRGKITRIIIWSFYDLGTMRCKDLFVTTVNFELIDVNFTKIETIDKIIEEHSVNISEIIETNEASSDLGEQSDSGNTGNKLIF